MKVIVPESTKDITLEQYIRFEALKHREGISDIELNKRAISIFTKIPYQKVGDIHYRDYETLILDIEKAIQQNHEFEYKFKLMGNTYGFIPNLDTITQSEFMDALEYDSKIKDLPKLMAVLFRKIVKEDPFGNYTIERYNGTEERAELFKQMPMHIVLGAVGFFLTLSKQLKIAIQKSTLAELAKVQKLQSTSRSGDGTQPLTT